jgi:hypothetical protein
MSKPVTGLTSFEGQAPPWSLVSLDTNFTSITAAINDLSTYANYLSDTSGSANTITLATPSNVTCAAYVGGLSFEAKVANTTTSSTVNINLNALGNVGVVTYNGGTLNIGQLVSGGIYRFIYDGTNFRLISPSASPGIQIYKSATTTRASTTSLTTDPDITVSIPAAGTYEIRSFLGINPTGAGGFNGEWEFSGTLTGATNAFSLMGANLTGLGWTITPNYYASISSPFTLTNSTAFFAWISFLGTLQCSTSGTFALYWAQDSSNASGSSLLAGSSLVVTPLVSA